MARADAIGATAVVAPMSCGLGEAATRSGATRTTINSAAVAMVTTPSTLVPVVITSMVVVVAATTTVMATTTTAVGADRVSAITTIKGSPLPRPA